MTTKTIGSDYFSLFSTETLHKTVSGRHIPVLSFLCVFLLSVLWVRAAASGAGPDSYAVGEGDVLSIQVFDNPDFSGDFEVTEGGAVIYPFYGKIKVAGRTVDEIRALLTKKLGEDYLYHPVVSVQVKTFRSQKVTVFGSVGSPGAFYLERATRLFELLSKADAISPMLGKIRKGQDIRIVRKGAKPKTLKVDAYELIVEGRESVNLFLKSGDLIYLPKIRQIHVASGVDDPGAFVYEEGMTVLKAITLAGGPPKGESVSKAFVRRVHKGKESRTEKKMGDLLQPEDIVEVVTMKESREEVHVIGEVKRPGTVAYEKGLTVLTAISKAGGATKKASVKNTVIRRIRGGQEIKIKVKMRDNVQPGDIVEVPLSFW